MGVAPTERPLCRRGSRMVWSADAGGNPEGVSGRRTWHCSRPLRARDRWVFNTLVGARSRQLNAKPLGERRAVPLPEQTLLEIPIRLGCDCDAAYHVSGPSIMFGILPFVHQLHRRVWMAVCCLCFAIAFGKPHIRQHHNGRGRRLPFVHQLHRRMRSAVRRASAPLCWWRSPARRCAPDCLSGCLSPISSTVGSRIWQAADRSSYCRSRLAGCRLPISSTVAFGQLIRGHGQAIRERAKTVAYRAARQTTVVNATVSGGAPTQNAPYRPAQKAVQRPAGATTRAHTPLSHTASPAVRPATLRDHTRAWYNAIRQFV